MGKNILTVLGNELQNTMEITRFYQFYYISSNLNSIIQN